MPPICSFWFSAARLWRVRTRIDNFADVFLRIRFLLGPPLKQKEDGAGCWDL